MQEKTIHTPSPKNFNLMVSGQIISILGSALLRFALSLYVLDTTGSGSLFATLFAISNMPLLLAPLGGAIADRFNRRNLMVIFDFTSSAIVLSLIILMSVGSISVFTAGTSMVLLSIVSALYTPAVTASIPLLVEEQKLEGANGLVQAVQALSAVAAPVLGGILYGLMGLKTVVAVSCISFFLSAVMELFIQIPFVKRQWTGPVIPAIARDMKEGFIYVLKQEFIRKVSMIAVLLNLVLIPYFLVGAPIVLRVTMQSSDTLYGIGMGLINSATILGALSIGVFAKKMSLKTLHRWLFACALMMVLMAASLMPLFLGLGYYPSFILFMLGAIPIAASMTVISIYIITKVQKITPDKNLGKVMAIITAVSQCAAPLGQILYGVIFEKWSTQVFIPTFLVGIMTLLLGVLTWYLLKYEEVTPCTEN
ncbi:MFS transporter [Lachnoclostridium pacaense]|uniref:MFS transporter n=1 Tax=Enterocloster hominis (ex Hitch et al. 2024) TaxID=1917870 RepID=UPI001D1247B8|nr:MFS transporter [Lachnoclostridium pacaense]MCC2876206.1 MFS transporter [Lachnoclostridium pacaense]